jgi:hypothetical protein
MMKKKKKVLKKACKQQDNDARANSDTGDDLAFMPIYLVDFLHHQICFSIPN